MARPQRSACRIEDEPVSSASCGAVPSSSCRQAIGPPGSRSATVKSSARRTAGQSHSRKASSPELRWWCQAPTAMYAQKLVSFDALVTSPSV